MFFYVSFYFSTKLSDKYVLRNTPEVGLNLIGKKYFPRKYHYPCYVENGEGAAFIGFLLSKAGVKLHSFFDFVHIRYW